MGSHRGAPQPQAADEVRPGGSRPSKLDSGWAPPESGSAKAARSIAYLQEPWYGLTAVNLSGPAGDTRYTVSVSDVSPLSAQGDYRYLQAEGSTVTLRLEWQSTANDIATQVDQAWVEIKRLGGTQIGTTDWKIPINRRTSGAATHTFSFTTDPLGNGVGQPLAGQFEIYLYLEKTETAAGTLSWADSRGEFGGRAPRQRYARGLLVATPTGSMLGVHIGEDPYYPNWACPENEVQWGQDTGKQVAMVRIYEPRWKLPGSCVQDAFDHGKLPVVSFKPPQGGWKAWADNTASSPTLAELADWFKARDKEFIIILHHEPYDDMNSTTNTSYHYHKAFETARRIFRQQGARKAVWGYCSTTRALEGTPAGSSDPTYPGDDLVDLEMHDVYNWYSYRPGGNGAWHSFAEQWKPYADMARRRGHLLIPGETGSHPGSSTSSRNQWYREAANWIKNDPSARGVFVGFHQYNSDHVDEGEKHFWTIDHHDGSAEGWKDGFILPTPHNQYRPEFFSSSPFRLR